MRERAEEVDRLGDEVVEVEGVRPLQRALVVAEDVDEDALGGSFMFAVARVGLGIRQLVLELGDAALRAAGGQAEGIRLDAP